MAQIELSGEFLNSSSSTPIVRVKDVWDDNNVSLTELLKNGGGSGSAGVSSLNSKTGAVTIEAGTNVTIDNSVSGKIKISASGTGGGQGEPGVGIQSLVNYYKASSSKPAAVATTVNPTTQGWSTTSPELSETANVRWWFMRVTYTDGSIVQSDITEIGKLNQDAQVDYDEVNRRVEEAIADTLSEANRRLKAAEDRLDSLDQEKEGWIETLNTLEARKVYTDDSIKALAELVVDGKGYITLNTLSKNDAKGILSTAGLDVDAVNGVVKASADYATKTDLGTVGSRIDALEGKAETYATKAYADGKVSDARTAWEAGDKAAIISAVTSGNKVLVKNGVYSDYAYDPNTYASITAYEAAMTSAGYTIKVISSEMSTIKQEANKISMLVGTDGKVKASVIVDAINEGSVTIDAAKINLNGYVTTAVLEAKVNTITESLILKPASKLQVMTTKGMEITIGENGLVMNGTSGSNLFIDIRNGQPTLYMKNTNGESFYLNPTVWLSLDGPNSYTAVYVANSENSTSPSNSVAIYLADDGKYYSATSPTNKVSGTYYQLSCAPIYGNGYELHYYDANYGTLRETWSNGSIMAFVNFARLHWSKLTITNGVAVKTDNGFDDYLIFSMGSSIGMTKTIFSEGFYSEDRVMIDPTKFGRVTLSNALVGLKDAYFNTPGTSIFTTNTNWISFDITDMKYDNKWAFYSLKDGSLSYDATFNYFVVQPTVRYQ